MDIFFEQFEQDKPINLFSINNLQKIVVATFGVAFIIVGGIIAFTLLGMAKQNSSSPTIAPITTTPVPAANEPSPTEVVQANANLIAYNTNPQLNTANAAAPLNAPGSISHDTSPSWSPDGRWIVFTTNRNSPSDIYRMRPDGTETQHIRSYPGADGDVQWSPDGQWLSVYAYSGYYGYYQTGITRMRPDGTDIRNLSIGAVRGERNPIWSPDGQWIAFINYHTIQGVPPQSEIGLMRADGSQRRMLTTPIAAGIRKDNPVWSPDGQWLLYEVIGGDVYSNIYRMRFDGSMQQQLTHFGGSAPVWSPDGQWIVYEHNGDIYRMYPDGSMQQQLTRHPAADWEPVWSPDSQWILFTSERDNNREIYIVRVDGGMLVNLTNAAGQDEAAIWSPDGQWIAFSSNRAGSWDVYRMRRDGSETVNLTYQQQ